MYTVGHINEFCLMHCLGSNLCVCLDGAGMLVVHVASDSNQPGVPVLESSGKSSEALTLQVYQ